jgi:hypothetical protein
LESVPWLPLAKVAQKRLRLHMSREEALAVAAAEGLVLVPAANASGFRGVTPNRARFSARVSKKVRLPDQKRREISLGFFATAEEAALAYARHVRARGEP